LPLVAVSASRNPEWTIRVSVSRNVVFHSTALAVSGLFLLLIAGAGYYMRYFGGEWGRLSSWRCCSAGRCSLVMFFSGAFRARLKVFLAKNFFAYRYDYRTEWLGVTQSLSVAGDGLSLGESVIKALANLVESSGGGVWLRDANGAYSQQARLNMPPSGMQEQEGLRSAAICWRTSGSSTSRSSGGYSSSSKFPSPAWVQDISDMWLIVPLISSGVLVGFVVLLAAGAGGRQLGGARPAQDGRPAGGKLFRPDAGHRGLAGGAQVRRLQSHVGLRGPRSEESGCPAVVDVA
jgi:putative PEP-CTERM system histidine kinase